MNDNGTSDGEANASLAVEAHVGQRNEHLAVIEIGTLSVILVLAVVSNLFMMVAIWRQRRNRPLSRMYFFMLHLSMADLMVAIFHILPQLAWDITYSFQGGASFVHSLHHHLLLLPFFKFFFAFLIRRKSDEKPNNTTRRVFLFLFTACRKKRVTR